MNSKTPCIYIENHRIIFLSKIFLLHFVTFSGNIIQRNNSEKIRHHFKNMCAYLFLQNSIDIILKNKFHDIIKCFEQEKRERVNQQNEKSTLILTTTVHNFQSKLLTVE